MTKDATNPARYCRNCHYPLPHYGQYCASCGQKYTTGKISAWTLLWDLLESILNVDSKIFRTLGAMFIPGRLTEQYFKGRHKRYVPPLRLFFVMAIVHFAVIGYVGFDELEQKIMEGNERQWRRAHYADFRDQMDSARQKLELAYASKPLVNEALDSLEKLVDDPRLDSIGLGYFRYDQASNAYELKQVQVPIQAALEMPLDSFTATYSDGNFFSEIQLRQAAKFSRRGSNFTNFILGKLVWMVFLMMPALALLLKLLYIRRKQYYVEHLVFSFHYHAFAFSIFSVALLLLHADLSHISPLLDGDSLLAISFIWVMIYLFWAMRRFYRQHWFKTFIKYCVINLSYTFIFTLFLTLTVIVSALLF